MLHPMAFMQGEREQEQEDRVDSLASRRLGAPSGTARIAGSQAVASGQAPVSTTGLLFLEHLPVAAWVEGALKEQGTTTNVLVAIARSHLRANAEVMAEGGWARGGISPPPLPARAAAAVRAAAARRAEVADARRHRRAEDRQLLRRWGL